MKYIIKFSDINDRFRQPWDMVVKTPEGEKSPLVVQEPHPYANCNLFGFEKEPQACEVIAYRGDWEGPAVGMAPVLCNSDGMFSLQGLRVEEVIKDERCETCWGVGELMAGVTCPDCKGKGVE